MMAMLLRLYGAWRRAFSRPAPPVLRISLDPQSIKVLTDEIERETMRRMRAQYGAQATWARGRDVL